MQQEKTRLRGYRRLLSSHSGYLSALTQCRKSMPGLAGDELLYLHTMAPVILDYTEWVLDQAVHAGQKRLYFLARDAYPVYLAARQFCEARGLSIDCRYLKVSRYALRMAEYRLMGEDCVDRICIGGIRVTLRKILARAGVSEMAGQVADMLNMPGEEDRELSYAEIMALKPRLRSLSFLQEEIRKQSEQAWPGVLGYLEQEGMLDDVPYALVDSGWVGTLQQTMERILRSRKDKLLLRGYYFGLYELPSGVDPGSYHSYYFSPHHGLSRKAHFSNCLFETLCSAPHGMTIGYEETEAGFVPVLDGQGLNYRRMERYCLLMNRFVEAYARIIPEKDAAEIPNAGRRACLAGIACISGARTGYCSEQILRQLMGRPQRWEAEAFGSLLFCDDVLEKSAQPVAAPLSEKEIREQRFFSKILIMLGFKKKTIHESAWIEGSIALVCKNTWCELFHASLYKYFVYLRKQIRVK